MSTLLARIMLAIFLLPSAALLYTITLVTVMELELGAYPFRNRVAWITAALVTWAFVATYWILLWRKAVVWDTRRSRWTLLAAGGAAIAGGVAGILTAFVDDDFGFFVFSSVATMVWLPLTVLVWRERPSERAQRLNNAGETVLCPVCGYSLRGLSGARCPECGATFTLDDLWSRQPTRDARELER